MAMVPSSIKIKRDGVEYLNNVDVCQYTIFALTLGALRDVGKFVCKRFKQSYYRTFKKQSGRVGQYSQYWVRSNKKYQDVPDVMIGIKPGGFYGMYQEIGTRDTQKYGLLQGVVRDNLDEIIKIESQYLTALNTDEPLNTITVDMTERVIGWDGGDDY